MAIRKKKTAKKTAAKKAVKKAAVKKTAAKKTAVKKKTTRKAVAKTVRKAAKKAAPKLTRAMTKKKTVKKAAVKKTAKKKVAKKSARAAAPPKVSKTQAVQARKATHAAMKKALKMAHQAREEGAYGGGPSFSALRGHPTAQSEAQEAAHVSTPDVHDDRAHIEQGVAKNVQGHIAAQVRRSQGQRDHR